MRKYKIGDKVRVVKDISSQKDSRNYIITSRMAGAGGEIGTITEVHKSREVYILSGLKGFTDRTQVWWEPYWIEPAIIEYLDGDSL